MYKIRQLTEKELSLCDSIFQDFYIKNAVIDFKMTNWNRVIVENLQLLEEHHVDPFFNILRLTNSPGIIIMPIVSKMRHEKRNLKGYTCIEFLGIPNKEEFLAVCGEEYYDYTGGMILSMCNKIAMFSEVDNSLLYIGYDRVIESEVLRNFPPENNVK